MKQPGPKIFFSHPALSQHKFFTKTEGKPQIFPMLPTVILQQRKERLQPSFWCFFSPTAPNPIRSSPGFSLWLTMESLPPQRGILPHRHGVRGQSLKHLLAFSVQATPLLPHRAQIQHGAPAPSQAQSHCCYSKRRISL